MKQILKLSALLYGVLSLPYSLQAQAQENVTAPNDNAPSFIIPIECELGQDCFTQNYVDMDPGRGATDQECGNLTYDAHKGTDFRVRDIEEMNKGVKVLAAADGIVKGYRDGEHDGLYMNGMQAAVKDKECGNGVLIDHGNGWTTQYCHMKKGSIYVQRGKEVRAGDRLGEVGLSGRTEFPHLHFQVTHNNAVVNPYTGTLATKGCGTFEEPLWQANVRANTIYSPTGVLNMGFSDEAVSGRKIELGTYNNFMLSEDSEALVFFVRIFGLQTGDTQKLTILKPDESELISTSTTHTEKHKAQYLKFSGKKRPPEGWPEGVYKGQYRLIRKGQILIDQAIEMRLGDEPAPPASDFINTFPAPPSE